MLKLIKLEWKKNHMKRYSRNALLLASLLGLFLFVLAFLGIANDPETRIPDTVSMSPKPVRTSGTCKAYTGATALSP